MVQYQQCENGHNYEFPYAQYATQRGLVFLARDPDWSNPPMRNLNGPGLLVRDASMLDAAARHMHVINESWLGSRTSILVTLFRAIFKSHLFV